VLWEIVNMVDMNMGCDDVYAKEVLFLREFLASPPP
jgi:hypothetical protein